MAAPPHGSLHRVVGSSTTRPASDVDAPASTSPSAERAVASPASVELLEPGTSTASTTTTTSTASGTVAPADGPSPGDAPAGSDRPARTPDPARADRWITAGVAALALAVYLRSLLPGIGY